MLKEKLLLFLVVTICMYFVLIGIFGQRGIIFNRNIEKAISFLEQQKKSLGSEIDSLNSKIEYLHTKEGIREAAIRVGLYVDGDRIYLFEKDINVNKKAEKDDTYKSFKVFHPWSDLFCLLTALVLSLIIVVISVIFDLRVKNETFEKQY